MEKQQALFSSDSPGNRHVGGSDSYKAPIRRLYPAILLTALFALYITLGSHHDFLLPRLDKQSPTLLTVSVASKFDWDTAATLPYLNYSSCYEDEGEFQCARLGVPLDYWNGTTNATLSLAIIRRPAVVPISDSRYGGAVLINPGGPGGSGIDAVIRSGPKIRAVLDSASLDDEDGKFYDLISFDPRDVGHTTPDYQCFEDSGLDMAWQIRTLEEGVFGSSDAAFGRLWAMAIARSGTCALPAPTDSIDVRPYVSTASVARDMLSIVESHGAWRELEAQRLVGLQNQRSNEVNRNILEAAMYRPGEEKIQYWGFSYGTYLGNTFAAMFPDRISRLVVDGVVDAYDYRQTLWKDNLADTEKDMHQFYYHCARAGYPSCALANETGETTAAGVEARFQNIIKSLLHNPLPVIGANAEVITYTHVKILVFGALYSPIQMFPLVASLLLDIESGNGTTFAALLRPWHQLSCGETEDSKLFLPGLNDVLTAIACTDGDDQGWVSKEMFNDFWQELANTSPTIGAMWANIRMACIHYPVRAVNRFVNPWEANTSHPLLLIGNTADPVTPLRNAHKMSKGFPGSVVLTQDSPGHCSLSAPSVCTAKFVHRYFLTGELPPEGTICDVDEYPFEGKSKVGEAQMQVETWMKMSSASTVGGMSRLNTRVMGMWYGLL